MAIQLRPGDRCSVTGGYVVHDPELTPLNNLYVYGDYCDGQIRGLTPPSLGEPKQDHKIGLEIPALVSFGEDGAGHIYAVSLEGPVYRLVERSTQR